MNLIKNIHILPTDKPSNLYYIQLGDLPNGKTFTIANEKTAKINLHKDLKEYQEKLIGAGWVAQNIYITNDKYIGLSYYLDGNLVRKGVVDDKDYWKVRKDYKKIILTTDQDLIADGIQSIGDKFLEWFIKNPSCEEVEIFYSKWSLDGKIKDYYEIIFPKEEFKKETQAYLLISNYYGQIKTKRSGIPLINHIDEGIKILKSIDAENDTIEAYCLHPILQSDEEFNKNLTMDFSGISSSVLLLAMEYRRVANSYLSTNKIENFVGFTNEKIKQMLYADKIQNEKDFTLYHEGRHERSKELRNYFDNWLNILLK